MFGWSRNGEADEKDLRARRVDSSSKIIVIHLRLKHTEGDTMQIENMKLPWVDFPSNMKLMMIVEQYFPVKEQSLSHGSNIIHHPNIIRFLINIRTN